MNVNRESLNRTLGTISITQLFSKTVAGLVFLMLAVNFSGIGQPGPAMNWQAMAATGACVVAGLVTIGRGVWLAWRQMQRGAPRSAPDSSVPASATDTSSHFASPDTFGQTRLSFLTMLSRTNFIFGVVLVIFAGAVTVWVVNSGKFSLGIGTLVWPFFMLLGAFVTVRSILDLRRRSGIQANPVPVEAIVLYVRESTSRPPRWVLRYAYTDLSGEWHTADSHSMGQFESEQWRQYDIVEVLFDQRHPERSLLVGKRPLREATAEERRPHEDGTAPSS
jgi:hypothetical protein